MSKYTLKLDNGQIVKLDTDVSMQTMKVWKKNGLISKNFLGKLMVLEQNPTDFDTEDLENAIYLAYKNADNETDYSLEEFNEQISYDLETAGKMLSEMVSGDSKKNSLRQSFIQATTKSKETSKKKYPK